MNVFRLDVQGENVNSLLARIAMNVLLDLSPGIVRKDPSMVFRAPNIMDVDPCVRLWHGTPSGVISC